MGDSIGLFNNMVNSDSLLANGRYYSDGSSITISGRTFQTSWGTSPHIQYQCVTISTHSFVYLLNHRLLCLQIPNFTYQSKSTTQRSNIYEFLLFAPYLVNDIDNANVSAPLAGGSSWFTLPTSSNAGLSRQNEGYTYFYTIPTPSNQQALAAAFNISILYYVYNANDGTAADLTINLTIPAVEIKFGYID